MTASMRIEVATVGDECREAAFSDCGLYRYRLDILWQPQKPMLVTIALNPSTADHLKDDSTIRNVKRWAIANGYGSYRMLNAFALRSTDSRNLFTASDPVGRKTRWSSCANHAAKTGPLLPAGGQQFSGVCGRTTI